MKLSWRQYVHCDYLLYLTNVLAKSGLYGHLNFIKLNARNIDCFHTLFYIIIWTQYD